MRRTAALAVACVLALGSVAAQPGRASAASLNWIYNPATGHVYAQVDGVTWADAEAYAVKVGGHLVTIENQAEQDWLTATFPQPWLWIGLNDRAREGVWVWASGKHVAYSDWEPNEPDNWKGYDPFGEDAAVLNGASPGWDSISERWLGSGIIEVPGRPRTFAGNNLPTGTHDGSTNEIAYSDACYANGWAWDPDSPRRDVTVRILATRTDIFTVPIEVWRGPANEFREDLQAAGIGDGTASFWVDLRGLIEWTLPYEIRVQAQDLQTGEWVTIDGSPRYITCYQ